MYILSETRFMLLLVCSFVACRIVLTEAKFTTIFNKWLAELVAASAHSSEVNLERLSLNKANFAHKMSSLTSECALDWKRDRFQSNALLSSALTCIGEDKISITFFDCTHNWELCFVLLTLSAQQSSDWHKCDDLVIRGLCCSNRIL